MNEREALIAAWEQRALAAEAKLAAQGAAVPARPLMDHDNHDNHHNALRCPYCNPKGWVLVPLEPTIGMCVAGDSARHSVESPTRTRAVYLAMVTAAQGGASHG